MTTALSVDALLKNACEQTGLDDFGDGWFLANAAGTPTDGRQLASRAGLIIRERMVPDTALWPGVGSAGTLVPSTHPRYMPYAYGKQWYPTGFPFSAIDLSDAVHQRYRGSTSYPGSAWLNHGTDTASRRQTWDGQVGSLYLTAANAPGPRRNDETGTTSTTGFANWGANWRFSTAAPANDAARAALYAAAGGSPSPRKPYFYAENWRFVHLQQPAAGTSAGWWRTQFNDLNAPTPTSAASSPMLKPTRLSPRRKRNWRRFRCWRIWTFPNAPGRWMIFMAAGAAMRWCRRSPAAPRWTARSSASASSATALRPAWS